MDKNRELKDGEPCGHPGCLNHVTHPCEGCGRVGGRREKNREFAELVGLCWHEFVETYVDGSYKPACQKCGAYGIHYLLCNLDFAADPRLVLREMQRNGWFYDFVLWTLKEYVSLEQVSFWLDYYLLDTTGKLRDMAIEWMKGERKDAEIFRD